MIMSVRILEFDAEALQAKLEAFSKILIDSVADGASISFMMPLSYEEASQFWALQVQPEVAAGRRLLFGAMAGDNLLGTVQLLVSMPPNQPHRCEIVKLMVHPQARRRGLGRLLMNHALDHARVLGKGLVTLDTETGSSGELLYKSLGFELAGVIPDFAWDPDGQKRHSTSLMFRYLQAVS